MVRLGMPSNDSLPIRALCQSCRTTNKPDESRKYSYGPRLIIGGAWGGLP
jgi:hypothetical protein